MTKYVVHTERYNDLAFPMIPSHDGRQKKLFTNAVVQRMLRNFDDSDTGQFLISNNIPIDLEVAYEVHRGVTKVLVIINVVGVQEEKWLEYEVIRKLTS